MSIIFTDGFDYYTTLTQKWTAQSGVTPSISATAARTGGQGLLFSGGGSPIVQKQVVASQEHATFIVGYALMRASANAINTIFYSDSLATTHVTVQITTNGEIKVFRGTTGGTQLGSTTSVGTVPAGSFCYIEVKVTLHDSTGVVTVRVNGAQVFTITGADTKNGGTKTVLDGFGLGGSAGNNFFDDLVVMNGAGSTNNDFIGDVKIETRMPSGAGNTTQLTPSSAVANWTTVDETPANTTDYNGSATNDQYDTYAMQDLATAAGVVFAVVAYAYAAKSDAGAKGGAIVIRSGGTDYEKTDNALGTGFAYLPPEIMETDPATSAAWTIAGVNAMEPGFKVKAS